MVQEDKLKAAIERNLNELGMSIYERKAFIGMIEAKPRLLWNFFTITYYALQEDTLSHTIKVLDEYGKRKVRIKNASFWYIYEKHCKKEIESYLGEIGEDIHRIYKLSKALKTIRDKTHFHIDLKKVNNTESIWRNANITWKEFDDIVNILWKVLNYIYKLRFNERFPAPDYEGEDVKGIIKAVREKKVYSYQF